MHVLLTLDLPNAQPAARKLFDDAMEKEKWTKRVVTTTWTASFAAGTSEAAAINTTKNDVERCARAAGLKDYSGIIAASASAPTTF